MMSCALGMEKRVIEGIIYKVMPYLESNRLLYTYTPHGKMTLHARGAQKMTSPLRVASQYFTHIEFDVTKKDGLMPVNQLRILNDFQEMKSSFESLKEVAILLELIQHCVDEDAPHQSIYQELMTVINSSNIRELSLRFIMRLLKVIGYDLNLQGDGREVKGFHLPSARLIYEGDSLPSDISMEELILLLQLKYTNYDTILTISKTHLNSLKTFLMNYIEYHVQIKLKNR